MCLIRLPLGGDDDDQHDRDQHGLNLNPKPYTLHPTPYTLNPKTYTQTPNSNPQTQTPNPKA